MIRFSCGNLITKTLYSGRCAGKYRAGAERLRILNDQFGVYRYHTIFNCTEACPRDIHVTQAIGEVKKAIATGKIE